MNEKIERRWNSELEEGKADPQGTAVHQGIAYKWIRFFEVFERCNFNVRAACREFDISSATFYRWNKQPKFKALYKEFVHELVLEAEESHRLLRLGIPMKETMEDGSVKIIGWVEKPDREAIQFFLKCHGGWQPQQQVAEYQPVINIRIDSKDQQKMLDNLAED